MENHPNHDQAGLAQALAAAHRDRRTEASAPWAATLQSDAQAYEVQAAVAAALGWSSGDAVPTYWKSGGASRTAVLTHAPLPPAGVRASPASFDDLAFHSPGIESEIALRLGREVSPALAASLDHQSAVSLVEAMAVSVEIVDSRWREAIEAPRLLRVADSQSHGALALGDWQPHAAVDWAAQHCETRIGTAAPAVHVGTYALADPAWLLPIWLRHATRNGQSVAAGTVVTTGSWVGILPCRRGDQVSVDFPGIGSVRLRV